MDGRACRNIAQRSGEMKDGKTPYTPDTEDVSGEFLSHLLERQLSFSREATSLKQGGSKVFFWESRTTPPRRLLEMHHRAVHQEEVRSRQV